MNCHGHHLRHAGVMYGPDADPDAAAAHYEAQFGQNGVTKVLHVLKADVSPTGTFFLSLRRNAPYFESASRSALCMSCSE